MFTPTWGNDPNGLAQIFQIGGSTTTPIIDKNCPFLGFHFDNNEGHDLFFQRRKTTGQPARQDYQQHPTGHGHIMETSKTWWILVVDTAAVLKRVPEKFMKTTTNPPWFPCHTCKSTIFVGLIADVFLFPTRKIRLWWQTLSPWALAERWLLRLETV